MEEYLQSYEKMLQEGSWYLSVLFCTSKQFKVLWQIMGQMRFIPHTKSHQQFSPVLTASGIAPEMSAPLDQVWET